MASRRRQPRLQQPQPPLTANEQFFDALIRHQIGLSRLSARIQREVLAVLDATEKDLRRAIRDRLRRQAGLETSASVRRLERLLREVREIRSKGWAEAAKIWGEEMRALAASEPVFVDGLLKTVVPVSVETTLPEAGRLRQIVTVRPFEGRVMREWARSVRRADISRIQDQIRIGLVQGESVPEIARRVTGTVRLRGTNGVTEISRRHAAGITRTAVNAIANQARREYARANSDILDDELYVATLDAATTAVCRGFDGQRFPVGEGPIPPLHFNCRSLRTPILDEEALGKRPMKPVTERGLLREFSAAEGIEPAPRRRADLPRGTKGAFDAFARQRTRELIGRVPAKVSYQTWLGRQSVMFQEDVLGKTKARLFRRGKLPLERFVDETFQEKTLAELARSEAAAFRAAGLDPEDFL